MQQSTTVKKKTALFAVRLPLGMRSEIKIAAAVRGETIQDLVIRALGRELRATRKVGR